MGQIFQNMGHLGSKYISLYIYIFQYGCLQGWQLRVVQQKRRFCHVCFHDFWSIFGVWRLWDTRNHFFEGWQCMSCVFLPVIAYWNRPTNTWVVLQGGLPVLNAVSFTLMRPGWNNPYIFFRVLTTPHLELETLGVIQPPKCKHFPGGEYCLQPLWKRGTLEERVSPPTTPTRPTPDPTERDEGKPLCIEVLQKIAASVQCNEVEELQSRLIEERRNLKKHGGGGFWGGKGKGSFFFCENPLENIWKNMEEPRTSECWGSFFWNF